MRAHAWRRSISACAAPGRRPTLSLAGAAGGGDVGSEDQGQAPRLVRATALVEATVYDRYALRRRRRVRRPGDHRGARGDHGRRRPAIASRSTRACNLRIARRPRRRARGDRHVRHDASSRPCAASSPIRSRSRSCGAASSTSSRRCGSRSAAPPSRWSSRRRRISPASCSIRRARRSPIRRAPCRCST